MENKEATKIIEMLSVDYDNNLIALNNLYPGTDIDLLGMAFTALLTLFTDFQAGKNEREFLEVLLCIEEKMDIGELDSATKESAKLIRNNLLKRIENLTWPDEVL